MGNIIGYARVSTEDQNLSSQVDELTKAGCEKIFEDIVSGAKAERKGLEDCLSTLQAGDTLMVWRIDRLGRSLKHLVDIVTDLKDRGIKFKSLRDGAIDTTTASGELIFNIFCNFVRYYIGLSIIKFIWMDDNANFSPSLNSIRFTNTAV